ncbi:MAG: FAD-binding oxidoreductase [Oligoflexia bacterium]|nr:FAD-binding oxidoreductase [Oligoflexia bacterium]
MKTIIEDFHSIIGSENVISDDQKTAWGKDYTKAYTPDPLLAVLPKSTDEVQEILRYCHKNKISVVPSGGRTGLSGGAVATQKEVVISTARMKKIYDINKIEKTIHCQAGVVTKELQRAAWDAGLYFPVDFASSGSSQIGGNIATNAGGIKVIRYGLMRQWVLGIQAVLADGTVLNMDNVCMKNNTGYDLKHLFIGSEGTLGIITEAILNLTTQHDELLVSIFGVPSLEKVTLLFDLVQKMKLNLTAYEFFTESSLKYVQEHTHLQSPFSGYFPFYALIEIEKTTPADQDKLEQFVEKAMEEGLILDGVMAQSSAQSTEFWGLRENIAESITALTVAHKNDISLPLSKITAFCTDLQKMIDQKYPGFEVVNFGHIGDGNLHVNFVKPEKMSKDEFFAYTKQADVAMFELVKKYGGSISAEHGVGLTKKPFLHFTRSPEEIALMKSIKKVFDPLNIMNPGKIF